jgi:DNA-binding NtrC family response regulator
VGSQVLVVAARREVRHLVRDALHASGLLVDFVSSVDEAREFCRDGLPHAVVHEAVLGGRSFDHLRQELLQAAPTLAFVQITEDDPAFDRPATSVRQHASVGRAAIVAALPGALVNELARRG